MKQDIRRVEKPWGYELIWAHSSRYVGKILSIKADHQLSLQYHVHKVETIYLQSGEMILQYENQDGSMSDHTLKPGDAFHIGNFSKHRMIAIKDCKVFEVSTPELDDVVRIEDSYGRVI